MAAWRALVDSVQPGGQRRTRLLCGGQPMGFARVLRALRDEPAFGEFFVDSLRRCRSSAYLWETPRLECDNVERPFEYVQVEAPALAAMRADRHSFAEHFERAGGQDVVSFASLGGDATLVAPCPLDASTDYRHLALFLAQAPSRQLRSLWQRVALETLSALESRDAPLWLSTNGLGVAWLHVRLDSRPKYYHHAPYRS